MPSELYKLPGGLGASAEAVKHAPRLRKFHNRLKAVAVRIAVMDNDRVTELAGKLKLS